MIISPLIAWASGPRVWSLFGFPMCGAVSSLSITLLTRRQVGGGDSRCPGTTSHPGDRFPIGCLRTLLLHPLAQTGGIGIIGPLLPATPGGWLTPLSPWVGI